MSLEGSVVPLDGPQPAISSAAASGYTISRYEILDLGLPLSVKRLIIHGLVLSLGVIIIGHFRPKGPTRPIITVVPRRSHEAERSAQPDFRRLYLRLRHVPLMDWN